MPVWLLAIVCVIASEAIAQTSGDIRVIRDVSYKADASTEYEQERCKLDWYLPGEGIDSFPVLIWFHGGGLQQGHKADDIATDVAERFARDGIAVASVNYRLSPEVSYPAYLKDAAAAVAFVLKNASEHGGRSDQVFVSGHSAGGYLTAMVAMDPSLLEAHGTTRNSLAGVIPVSGQMITHSTVRKERGIPRSQPIVDEAAPPYHATADAPPFLCIVGSEDLPARTEENQYFAAAMKAAGHDSVSYSEFEGRDHRTIANQMGQPNDEVAAAIKEFIESTIETRSQTTSSSRESP